MDRRLNFLYCFDDNYDIQAFSSIISLLDSVDEVIDLHVLHNDNSFDKRVPLKIRNHQNLGNIEHYQFNDYDYFFPNIKEVHISVATYFRLFIANYLPKEIQCIIYLDPDVICVNNPIEALREEVDKLIDSEKIISARTEHVNGEKRIGVDKFYFNAGVMVIDMIKWRESSLQEKLLFNLDKHKNNIIQWDQDVLNSFFNGDYVELNDKFNHKADSEVGGFKSEKTIFIHFMGSHKPWLTSGIFMKDSYYYHKNYQKIEKNQYHILHKWKKRSLVDFLWAVASFKILRIEKPIVFIKELLISLIKS